MSDQIWVNGQAFERQGYLQYHKQRVVQTLEKVRELGARKIVELGGHPWVMTSYLIDDPQFEVCATVSAEEVTKWPDDIGVTAHPYRIKTSRGREASFTNYSVNLERTRFEIKEKPDTVLACEIVEHFARAPHVMFLNINRWLPIGGKLLITTPNGSQFSNPFRRKPPAPAYRCHIYERHQYLFTLDDLVDLVALCGFKIREAGYWKVYQRKGLSMLYDLPGAIPLKYFKDKFQKTIFVVGEKEKDVAELPRTPRVYGPNADWEFIANGSKSK